MPNKIRKFINRLFASCFGKEDAIDNRESRASNYPGTPIELTPRKQEKIQRQARKKNNAKLSKGGVSFDVGYRPPTPYAKPPSRLTGDNKQTEAQIEYNIERKQMVAELGRINLTNATIKKARSFSSKK